MLSHGDGNLANLVWDGSTVRVVDHEDGLRAHLARLGLASGVGARRLEQARTLMATFWLVVLVPGGRGHRRNPPGSDQVQARRLLDRLDALG